MKKILRKVLRISLLALLGGLVVVAVYYTIVILQARDYTRKVIVKELQSQSFALELNDLKQSQLDTLLAVEDPAFYQHHGIDLLTPGAGLTTITQALVKKLCFKNFKPGFAKIKQTLLAVFALNPLVSKDDQLRLFINRMYLGSIDGESAIGFAAAAQTYYHKTFQELDEDEYIALVAMLIAPKTFNIIDHPAWNAERVARIKKLISGEYTPKGLMDMYYGKLPPEVIQAGIAPFSYFEKYYIVE